ncbi:MAG: biotin/lipoyl-containing protein, partial [Steroidobacteraceae bacterium]
AVPRPAPLVQQASTAPASAPAIASAPVAMPPAGTRAVPAPLLGIFYHAPKPGEPPFVTVGSRVTEETTIGIIEVMKLMNTVRAGIRGEIVAIPASNGELVEFGAPLLFVRPH